MPRAESAPRARLRPWWRPIALPWLRRSRRWVGDRRMCGIAGYYGRFERSRLERMTRAMVHRGPDGEGHDWRPGVNDGEVVGIGHRRLAIIDLATGQQPMWSADGQIG